MTVKFFNVSSIAQSINLIRSLINLKHSRRIDPNTKRRTRKSTYHHLLPNLLRPSDANESTVPAVRLLFRLFEDIFIILEIIAISVPPEQETIREMNKLARVRVQSCCTALERQELMFEFYS